MATENRKAMKTLALAAAVVLLAAAPAFAVSDPKRPGDYTVKCGRANARVWIDTRQWTADNRCGRWLGIGWGWPNASDSTSDVLYVEAGARFGPAKHDLPRNYGWMSAWLTDTPDFCNQGNGSWVVHRGTHGRFDDGGGCA